MTLFIELTHKIKLEFGFSVCFLCNRHADQMVVSEGDSSEFFFSFLKSRLDEKDDSYFSEVRFFRYRNAKEQTVEHLALIPIEIGSIPFSFLGVVYSRMEDLDHLLKTRLLPAYLTHWLKNLSAESELSQKTEEQVRRLVSALEEKRQYTSALESQLDDLKKRMEEIRSSKGGKDVEIFALRGLLEDQVVEYQQLVKKYKELFAEYENIEKEYIAAVVKFETQVYLKDKIAKGDMAGELKNLISENRTMKQDLMRANVLRGQYQNKYQQILKSFANWSPDDLAEFQKKIRHLGKKRKQQEENDLQD